MKATDLVGYLQFAISNRFAILIEGKPGIGKSDIVTQATAGAGAKLLLSHPVVSDPTDFKGLPYPRKDGSAADFLPFGDLKLLMTAEETTVFFLDDLGQAQPSVQAASMQLLLARQINGYKISDKVIFIAATNRKEDKAGVMGLLEPVKSRFISIIHLETDTNDWVDWALNNNMPTELIAFIRWRPELLDDFQPSREMVNSPSPRTVSAVGKLQAAGLPANYEYEAFKGAAGEAFAREYLQFLKLYRELPSIDSIILDPQHANIPKDPGALYALSAALGKNMNDQNIGPVMTYLDRLPIEINMATVKDATIRNKEICNNRAFIQWASKHSSIIL